MNKREVKPGKYWYNMPRWKDAVEVEVRQYNNGLFVIFSDQYAPIAIRDIPYNADFTPIEEK